MTLDFGNSALATKIGTCVETPFHAQTLALLALPDQAMPERSARLRQWARTHHLVLPASVVDWVERMPEGTGTFTGFTVFAFRHPSVVDVPGRGRALVMQKGLWREFIHVVLLDGQDDPPVLFHDQRRGWVEVAGHFSHHVLGEVFDRRDGRSVKIRLKGEAPLDEFRRRFVEVPSTKDLVRGDERVVHRFRRSPSERIVVTSVNGDTIVDILGTPLAEVEAELRAWLPSIVDVDLRPGLTRLGYVAQWLDSGWLDAGLLLNQLEIVQADDDEAQLLGVPRGEATEHFRTGAFSRAFVDPRVHSGEALPMLLELIAADPDGAFAASLAYTLVSDVTPLSPEAALVAARHPVMARGGGCFIAALERMGRSGVPRGEVLDHATRLLSLMDAATQADALGAGADDDIFIWLAEHGANRRVRTFARHGLHLRRAGDGARLKTPA